MNEDYWYYEESYGMDFWIDSYSGYSLSRDEALQKMEARKKEYPRAKLRLVHCVKTRTPYAKRR